MQHFQFGNVLGLLGVDGHFTAPVILLTDGHHFLFTRFILHAQLGRAVRRLGLKTDERPYRPHLTLARHAARAQPRGRWPAFGWPVQAYALMESTGQSDARYRLLQQYGEQA